ncbi:MAG: DNA-3-methyladenine glycosylase I [Bacteroidetes bacterium]|nr:MAG: DNA-3-methyladenine glycosylase I [Bacteroidota bacterium]TNE99924.1 MAG: DNA-3-methyladenine glycosylase I [Bacteroidota bacterium]
MSYCKYCKDPNAHEVHRVYHDNHYGFPILDDNELFGRLILEINQAGLSWETILKKESGFRNAYADFNIHKIANFGAAERERLLSDPSIIRNRLKIDAVIHNANVILEIQKKSGTFKSWLDSFGGMNREEWTKIFKKNFKFVGGEIVNEFLMSTGYLKGAHEEECEVMQRIRLTEPKWMSYERD